MTRRGGAGAAAFVRSVVLLGAIAVGVPWLLVVVARARFAGGSPLHGVPAPADWDTGRIRDALTDRLTDDTIADIVIRSALLLAWAAVIVLVLTVVVETAHMVRHDGLAMPDVRGFGVSQSAARMIASGLLVVVPLFATPQRVIARDGVPRLPEARARTALVVDSPTTVSTAPSAAPSAERPAAPAPVADRGASAIPATSSPDAEALTYVVRRGDSIYGIAERLAGPDADDVTRFAEQLLDLNLGTRMPDGQRFTNAAFIDVGWVLQLPPGTPIDEPSADLPDVHVVERGESLWSIADDELGDGDLWPEIFEENEGRVFDDGRVLHDPDLIHPGWELELPVEPAAGDPTTGEPAATDEQMSDTVSELDPVPDVVAESEPPARPALATEPVDPDPSDATVEGAAARSAAPDTVPRPDNVWLPKATASERADLFASASVDGGAGPEVAGGAGTPNGSGAPDAPAGPMRFVTLGRAAMLSAGVLALLAVRRRNQLRRARPRARLPEPTPAESATERTLRAIDAGDRFERVDVAIRAAAPSLVEQGRRVVAALVGPHGDVELRTNGPAVLPAPWHGGGDRWQLDAATPLELLAGPARDVGVPCPTLVQLGCGDGDRDVYVDLEAIEALEVGGSGDQADAIVTAVAATLAGSVLAEVATLVGVGIPDEAFLGHRLHVPARDVSEALEVASDAVGSTRSAASSTFELRTRISTGETWEPAVVLVGAAAGTVTPPVSRTGLAIVSASPIHGPSSRLAPAGDAWRLDPLGLRFVPVGLSPDELRSIAALVEVADAPLEPAPDPHAGPDDDLTIVPPPEGLLDGPTDGSSAGAAVPSAEPDASSAPAWAVMVRLLGPVRVESPDGREVEFERSKTRELVAWLATHRERSTRTAARTALWELDVRDATFANVVSEARRSLARLVEPPTGEEWVGRTMTEALPLHQLVVTDADLLGHALDVALLQPPAQAIATLTPAVERIAGMPFEGTAYLWPDAEGITSSLVLLATSAATELAAHCLSVGDVDGVFRATGRGLRVLPGHEELIGLRMRAHARAGDHAGVRQEWESYERVITADPWSDGEPSPKLLELRRELLERR